MHGVVYDGEPSTANIACYSWDGARLERETWAFSLLAQYQSQHPDEPLIVPRFFGHLSGNGRPMSFWLEILDREPFCADDMMSCEALLGITVGRFSVPSSSTRCCLDCGIEETCIDLPFISILINANEFQFSLFSFGGHSDTIFLNSISLLRQFQTY